MKIEHSSPVWIITSVGFDVRSVPVMIVSVWSAATTTRFEPAATTLLAGVPLPATAEPTANAPGTTATTASAPTARFPNLIPTTP